jgi:uncharacterized membrane protein (DUF485 family)
MEDDKLIERLWAKRKEEPKMTREEISNLLRPRVGGFSRTLKMYVWMYLGVLLATLVLQGVNLAGYITNATMLTVQIAVTVAAIGFALYGIYLMGEARHLDRMDESLGEAVQRRLAFFRGKYEWWLWACAASLLLLNWAVGTMVDNDEGNFRINKPLFFTGINAVMFFGMYGILRLAHLPFVREMRAVLDDLDAQMTDRTRELDDWKIRWKWWSRISAVLLLLLLLYGAWKGFQAYQALIG